MSCATSWLNSSGNSSMNTAEQDQPWCLRSALNTQHPVHNYNYNIPGDIFVPFYHVQDQNSKLLFEV